MKADPGSRIAIQERIENVSWPFVTQEELIVIKQQEGVAHANSAFARAARGRAQDCNREWLGGNRSWGALNVCFTEEAFFVI